MHSNVLNLECDGVCGFWNAAFGSKEFELLRRVDAIVSTDGDDVLFATFVWKDGQVNADLCYHRGSSLI